MCNLNVLFVKNKTKDITSFLMCASSHSFVHNNHGEGIFINSTGTNIKSLNKIDFNKYIKEIEASKLVITHQRYSTSGFEVKYNHPFTNDNFVMVHNGVINQFKNGEGSDSFGFFNAFNKEFNQNNFHISREKKIVDAIKKLFKNDLGSYSILIYDKKFDVSYYFKNTPAIYFYHNKDYLFVTTEDDNKIFLPMIGTDFKELEIEERIIYKIDSDANVYPLYSFPIVEIPNIHSFQTKLMNTNDGCVECGQELNSSFYKFENENICGHCYRKIYLNGEK